MENRKKIDDLFRSELGNYSEAPPPAVWDALEKKLDNVPSRKPRSPFVWAGYLAMVCALVATVALVSRNISGNSSSNNVTATNTTGKQNNTPAKTSDNYSTAPVSTGNTAAVNTQNNTATIQNNDSKLNPTENKTSKPIGDQTTTIQKPTASIDDNTKHEVTNNRTNDRLSDIGKTTIAKNERHTKTGSKKQQQNSYSSTTQLKHNNESVAGTNAGRKTEAQVQNEYNSTGTKTDNTEAQVQNEYNSIKTNTGDDPKPSQEVANTDKKDPLPGNNDSNTPPLPPPPHKPKPKYTRFEAGIKGGYEFGFDNDAAKKAVIAPYLQYKISPKLAIMLQPAIKAASLNNKPIGDARSYYKINNDGSIVQHTDSTPIYIVGVPDTMWKWDYRYTQTHDSIIKTYATGGTYIEFEVPVLLKYYLTKDFSVYGGVNILYSQQIGIKEQTYISDPIQKTAYDVAFGPVGSPAPAPPQTLGTEITYTGSPISGYTGPLYTSPQGSLLRFGYMFGFSYEYSKKWLFDALIQQGQAKQNMQGGYNTNTALSAPYIRLTVGYKLTK